MVMLMMPNWKGNRSTKHINTQANKNYGVFSKFKYESKSNHSH